MSEENQETQDQSAAGARIRQLVSRVKELEGRVAELDPVAAQAEKWRLAVEEAKATSKAEREALQVERAIIAAGITDAEGVEYVQHAYSKLPNDNRPALADWLSQRDALPRAVRAYLPEAPAAAATTTPAAAPAAPPPQAPRTSQGTVPQTPSEPTSWTPEAIARLSPTEFKANREAIMAALRTG
jgi:hypothetical protein